MSECAIDKSPETEEEEGGKKKSFVLSLLSEQASRVQHKGGSIHRAQRRAPVLSNPKEKSIVCECDPSVPAPLHLSTLLSCHFYRSLNSFVRSLFISVWISAPHLPIGVTMAMADITSTTRQLRSNTLVHIVCVILWEHSELSTRVVKMWWACRACE